VRRFPIPRAERRWKQSASGEERERGLRFTVDEWYDGVVLGDVWERGGSTSWLGRVTEA